MKLSALSLGAYTAMQNQKVKFGVEFFFALAPAITRRLISRRTCFGDLIGSSIIYTKSYYNNFVC